MKIQYVMSPEMPTFVVQPYGYPQIRMNHNEVLEVSEELGLKLRKEFKHNIFLYGEKIKQGFIEPINKIIPTDYFAMKSLAMLKGYKGDFGWTKPTLIEFLEKEGYKQK